MIDGQYERNAYWQIDIDNEDAIHISWVWRETSDVATNHDLCYAVSKDFGDTWQRSDGQSYELPIDIHTAEVVMTIPQGSDLINQTSMATDFDGRPYIATYYRASADENVQIQVVFKGDDGNWTKSQVTERKTDFELSGQGTKKIPISRPQIYILDDEEGKEAGVIYRDAERGNKVTLATADISQSEWKWTLTDLNDHSLGDWEPSIDRHILDSKRRLHIFIQKVGQGDGETLMEMDPQVVTILEHSLEQ